MVVKICKIKVPLYYETIRVHIHNKLESPDYAALTTFEKDYIQLDIQKDVSPGILAHEAVHITNFIFRTCHIDADLVNDEPYAYLLGWIVEQISKLLK